MGGGGGYPRNPGEADSIEKAGSSAVTVGMERERRRACPEGAGAGGEGLRTADLTVPCVQAERVRRVGGGEAG